MKQNRPRWTRPDVFADLEGALIRGARNYHRLEQLGRRGLSTLHEETITDLLVAEMFGAAYEVTAPCPYCRRQATCTSWCGSGPVGRKVRMRPLTKALEGGNKASKVHGAQADIVLAFRSFDPRNRTESSKASEIRMLVQCKRVTPGDIFKPNFRQYVKLVKNAWRYGAVPYYGLYVQQPDAHTSSTTRCGIHRSACDRAIVLVPARLGHLDANFLFGKPVDDVLALGLPLRCLGGCRRIGGYKKSPDTTAAALAFVQSSFPHYQPVGIDFPTPAGAMGIAFNAAVSKPLIELSVRQSSMDFSDEPTITDDFVIVRLGKQTSVDEVGRAATGYDPNMNDEDVRNAARMYWRCDPERAAALSYLVAAHSGRAIRAYRIAPDGVTVVTPSTGPRRVAFDLHEMSDDHQRVLLDRADQALVTMKRGASNPVLYVDHWVSPQDRQAGDSDRIRGPEARDRR